MEIEAKKFILKCVVPENIHTPTTEGIGNSKGVVFKSLGNSRGVGVGGGGGFRADDRINFQMVQFDSGPT